MTNKSKIAVGLFLVVCAFLCAAAVFYFIYQKAGADEQRLAKLQVQLSDLIAQKSAPVLSKADRDLTERPPLEAQDVLNRTEKVYGKQALARKDGVLWIDRETATCIVTLGAANGLVPGTHLGIYQEPQENDSAGESQKIGEAVVDKTYDIISYVSLSDKTLSDFARDYYRVTVQDAPGALE
jgi:hypothetical protein